ncbi:hypothetical protein NEUTE1DRAFT_136169 [Neurospora tetrasperma FGSC 2508]|uniref:Uncharacterized protein n=1 Tax=Neurospora tetrasperma (strain FGSC 2508 / ATCC MYA-4615 / P0657) TaxID=510951 RepID=F8MJA5_NEUT8|nr:uncharacterized protein NEUTE1DRAFT_136169 [Neurospora tetrasperma FGSC 2508]EGO59102.1 hypothetical protein NEUTE1DRAFT_136169 [Neurospora tetrasperma FGSC 2508]
MSRLHPICQGDKKPWPFSDERPSERSGTWQAAAQKGQLTYDHVEPDGVLAPNPSLNPASLRP